MKYAAQRNPRHHSRPDRSGRGVALIVVLTPTARRACNCVARGTHTADARVQRVARPAIAALSGDRLGRTRRGRRGIALIMVLSLVAVAAVLGMGYLATSSLQMQTTRNLVLSERARYLAESGAMHGAALLESGVGAISYTANAPSGPYYADNTSDSYSVYATSLGSGKYTITSKATAVGISRTSQVTVELSSPYAQSVIALGPKCYYRLGETTGFMAADQMGYRNGIYRYGISKGVSGAITQDQDTAASFDGNYDHVDLGQGVRFICPALTVAAWVYAPNWSEKDGRILSQEDDQLLLRTDEKDGGYVPRFNLELSSGKKELRADNSPIPAGQWVFLVCTFDGSEIRIYQDAVLVATRSESGTVSIDKTDKKMYIGGNAGHLGDHDWNGKIDEVAIFERALSAAEIQALYSNAQKGTVTIISWDK